MNKVVSLLHTVYPLVQGPMLGVTTPEMVAAVSNGGALGSLPIGGLSPGAARELIRKVKQLTSGRYSVNLFAHRVPPAIDETGLDRMQDYLEQYTKERKLPFTRRGVAEFRFYSYEEQVDVLLEERIPVVSFTFGVLAPEIIERFKANGVLLIGTATSVAEAVALEQAGIDIITAQGIEAGGHRGSFLEEGLPQVGLFSLLPQVADAVSRPVLAAGGIVDARTIRAAFQLGAAGVQVGTLFIPSHESAASEAYKDAVVSAKDTDTALTRAFSGRWARGIRNEFMKSMEAAGIPIQAYTLQNSLTAEIRSYGQKHNLPGIVSLWAGQSAGKTRKAGAAELLQQLVKDIDFDKL